MQVSIRIENHIQTHSVSYGAVVEESWATYILLRNDKYNIDLNEDEQEGK